MDRTNFSGDVCEMALNHTIRNKTEAAYRRGDVFEKRSVVDAELEAVHHIQAVTFQT